MSVTQIEEGAVLHRHRRAMAVVAEVDDVHARFLLLAYVLHGDEIVEDAMRMMQTCKRSPLRRAAVVELHASGFSLQEIADELGYSHRSTPARLLHSAG